MNVSNILGAGFLEKVYENALHQELMESGFTVETQKPVQVKYKNAVVGEYFADIVVNGRVLVEVKAVRAMDETHQAQLLNYLKATGLGVGLILNFGTPRLGIKRMVL